MDLVYPKERSLFRIAIVLAAIFWLFIIVGTLGIALLYVGIFFLFAIFAQSAFISSVRGNGVRVTAEQYPDLYHQLKQCCETLEMEDPPEMYLLRTDFFNALATRFLRRHYVVLFTDVVDALSERPGAINFYIGHELGHIQRNHIRWGWILAPVLWLPVIGSAYRRAEEYTCDRYGSACCEQDEDAVAAIAAICSGDTRWRDIDVDAYLKQTEETGGFFMSFNELVSTYPWLCKRLAWVIALRDDTTPEFPRRNALAGFLSIFIPTIPGGSVSILITIAIIGILAAIALPAYQDYIDAVELAQQEASASADTYDFVTPSSGLDELSEHATEENLTKVLEELGLLRDQISAYYGEHQTLPNDLTQLGWENSLVYSDYGSLPVALYEGGILGVGLGSYEGEDAYFVNEPSINDNKTLDWYCYGQNVPEQLVPEICR